jgi:hypothetical protein
MKEIMIIVIVCLIVSSGIILADDVVDEVVKEDQVATKEPNSAHGWVYNNKTKVLQFCLQTTGEEYDENAEVLCISYPKKVKHIDAYDSFFLDGNPGYLPVEK